MSSSASVAAAGASLPKKGVANAGEATASRSTPLRGALACVRHARSMAGHSTAQRVTVCNSAAHKAHCGACSPCNIIMEAAWKPAAERL